MLRVLICTVHSTVRSYHVTYTFQSESTLSSCLNVKELLAQNRRDIWSLSDCHETRTNNHLVRKRILNHVPKRTLKWSPADLKACNFIKKRIQHRCFPVKLMKFLITLILKNIYKGLLLIIKLGFWDIFVKKYDFRELLSFFEKKSFVKDCGT